jgi:hypothetical protein
MTAGNSLTKVPKERLLDLMAVRKRPSNNAELTRIEKEVTGRIVALFEQALRPNEREAYRTGSASTTLLKKFDIIILSEAKVLGWRLLLSRPVQARLAQWWEINRNGGELFKRLGQALALGTAIIHGKGKLSIDDPNWYTTKRDAVEELRALLRQYKNAFASRNTWPQATQARAWFQNVLEHRSDEFRFLHLRRSSFFGYLDYIVDSAAAQRLYSGEIKPAELFDGWGAWSANISVERFRQMVSRMGSAKL